VLVEHRLPAVEVSDSVGNRQDHDVSLLESLDLKIHDFKRNCKRPSRWRRAPDQSTAWLGFVTGIPRFGPDKPSGNAGWHQSPPADVDR
ncbi:MAG: hypothetical protein M3396_00990, partial [Actinomycetota bacterium]|nr:hypothetical protein [Actinomycetota bacterium]